MSRTFKTVLLATALMAGPLVPAVAANPMTKDQITSQIIGHTLTTSRKGMSVRLTYQTDGRVTMKALIMSAKGTWQYSDTGLCMTMTSGPKKGETCVSFTDLGNGQYRNSQGMTLTVKN